MNTETYQAEVAKSQQITKLAINLIRAHYEPSSENSFLEASREVVKYFRETGNEQLAVYIDCLDGDEKNVWVPMEKEEK